MTHHDEPQCGEVSPRVGRRCTLPARHTVHRAAGMAWEEFRRACSCDADPIECTHEAARGQADEAIGHVRLYAETLIGLAPAGQLNTDAGFAADIGRALLALLPPAPTTTEQANS